MKTSIIVSTYNGSEYIVEQLESLCQQSRQADEVLIFDDASTDQTPLLIEQYIRENKLATWQLVINEKNVGWRKNFIQGMKKCSGELIFLCDQDDIWYTEKLEKMSTVMEENSEINLLVSTYIEKYADGSEKEYHFTMNNSGGG